MDRRAADNDGVVATMARVIEEGFDGGIFFVSATANNVDNDATIDTEQEKKQINKQTCNEHE